MKIVIDDDYWFFAALSFSRVLILHHLSFGENTETGKSCDVKVFSHLSLLVSIRHFCFGANT
jgi:hypothetical protein